MRACLLALVATGCSLLYDPDIGPEVGSESTDTDAMVADPDAAAPSAACVDSDPTTAVSFSHDIRPLMTRTPGGCTPCHLGRITSGLDLSSYASLRRGGINTGAKLVVTGDPCASILPQKLGRTPPFGSRMPFNGPPYFTAAERQLVRDWIAEGAQNN